MVSRTWKPMIPLNGHIYCYGRTDSGKTWKLIAVLQYYHHYGYKIWDLWGGKRKEGGFWCFPSDEKKLWFEYEKEVGEMSCPGEKEYNVNLLYPLFLDEIESKLPEKKTRIIARPFTLFFKKVGLHEISTITGGLSNQSQIVWNKIIKELPDKANSVDILEWFNTKETIKYKKSPIYKYFIEPFCNSGILMDKNCKYNLDIISEAKNKEVITVLMDDFTPEKFKMFFMLHIFKNIRELAEKDKIHRQHIAFFRELNYFMKVQDESSQDADQKQIMRGHFSEVVRYGRSAILLAGDTQSPSEVKGLVDGQEDILLINELPSQKDREMVCDGLIKDGRMSPSQRDFLGSTEMTQEKMVVVQRGDVARLIKRVQPPRTKCFKRSDGSFIKVWRKFYNHFRDIKEDINYLNKELSDRKRELKDRKNVDFYEDFYEDEEYIESKEGKEKENMEEDELENEQDLELKEDNEKKKQIIKINKLEEDIEEPIML